MTIPINVTGAQRKKCVNITNPNDNCSSIPNEINTKTPKKSNDPQPPAVDGNIPAKLAAVPKKRTVNISRKKLSKVKFTETAIKKYIVISKIQIKNEINNNEKNDIKHKKQNTTSKMSKMSTKSIYLCLMFDSMLIVFCFVDFICFTCFLILFIM